MSIRSLMVCLALVAVLTMASRGYAGVVLSLDFGTVGSPVESGFTAFNTTPSQTFGAITVTETSADGLFNRGASGAYAALYGDFLYTNDAGFSVQISGLLSSTPYQLKLYSFDSGLVGETTLFTPIAGTVGTAGSVTYVGSSPAVTDDQYSTLVTWTSDATGDLTFGVSATGPSGASTRLDGLVLSVPEPASLSLLGLGGLLFLRRRRA